MAPRPTVIGSQGYRRGLASLSVVKERLFRVHRNAPSTCAADVANTRVGACLVGLIRPRCAASPSSSAYLSFRWVFASCFSCPATCFGISLRKSTHSSLATNHCRKIKNPASSAGYSHSHLSGSTRCSTSF